MRLSPYRITNGRVSFIMSSSEFVKIRKEESALIVTLDNPPVNALNLKLLEEISAAIKQGSEDPEVRGIVITGAGNNAFCAGVRKNRLTLLAGLLSEFSTIADFSEIVTAD